MAGGPFVVPQGDGIIIDVTVRDVPGVAIVTYVGTEPLTATVSAGGNAAIVATPEATWTDPAAGTVAISISAAQTATLAPGRYQLRLDLQDGMAIVPAYRGFLDVIGSPGGIPTFNPPAILTPAEAAAGVPGFDPSQLGQLQLIYDATDALNRACDRIFPLALYDEDFRRRGRDCGAGYGYGYGYGTGYGYGYGGNRREPIRLAQYPVRRILRICGASTTAITATNATLYRPTLSVSAGSDGVSAATITLSGYLAGVLTTVTVDLTTHATFGAVVTAIGSAGNGWSASLVNSGDTDRPSSEIDPTWSNPGGTLAVAAYGTDVARYDLDARTGEVWAPSGTDVRVVYEAGFDSASMPASLKRAACILIKAMAQKSVVGMTAQSKSGDQFQIITADVMDTIRSLWTPFRRMRAY